MPKWNQVVLITGSSSGIGAACSAYLAERGYMVYGGSRRAQSAYHNFEPLVMDVTDDASVQTGIEYVLRKEGHIDVVINSAGIAYAGAVEDMTLEEAQHQFDVNFFGCFRVCRAVLPSMREEGKGTILTISSIGGLIGLPFQAFYSASKFALEGLMEGLSLEVRGKGIDIVLVEPGDIRTPITQNRIISTHSDDKSAYFAAFRNYVKKVSHIELEAREPECVARLVYKALETRSPKLRYQEGTFMENLGVLLRKGLPPRLFERIMASTYKL